MESLTILCGLTTGKYMDENEYFEANKDKIRATAEFLCKNDPSRTVDDKFEELKSQYHNRDGSHHSETIGINGTPQNINTWLQKIRHEAIENFLIIAVHEHGSKIIYKIVGNQFTCGVIDLNKIDEAIVKFIIFNGIISMGLYVIHNHPFIYKASPSNADLKTLEAIYNEIQNIVNECGKMRVVCQIELIDYAIVTKFDYWSSKQS